MSEQAKVKATEAWPEAEVTTLLDFAKANEGVISFEDIGSLQEKLPGKSSRQITAKAVSLAKAGEIEYRRKVTAKKPRDAEGQPMTKARLVEEIAGMLEVSKDVVEGLDNAPARALQAIRDHLSVEVITAE